MLEVHNSLSHLYTRPFPDSRLTISTVTLSRRINLNGKSPPAGNRKSRTSHSITCPSAIHSRGYPIQSQPGIYSHPVPTTEILHLVLTGGGGYPHPVLDGVPSIGKDGGTPCWENGSTDPLPIGKDGGTPFLPEINSVKYRLLVSS